MRLPETGRSDEEIFAELEELRRQDMPWRDGRTWAYVYDPGTEAEAVLKRAFVAYMSENMLDPTVFPSTLALENAVVAMAIAHLHGDPACVGNFTSGGTESLILAVKAARDLARATRPEVRTPELVLPETAHASFHKACHYLGVTPVVTPVHPTRFVADVEAIARAITENTVLVAASAVSYAHGVVDPIEEIAAVTKARGVPFHVDGCMGGFLLEYFRRLGAEVPLYDFRVDGVTSISMDLHKYAFAAKGASILAFRSKELRKHMMFACARWPGYTVVNPTVQSSKGAGPVAAAWAILQHFGEAGYLDIARTVLGMTRRLVAGIGAIEGLAVLGEPSMNLVAFASTDPALDVFHLADEMRQRRWYVQPQLGFGPSPKNIHLSVNPESERWVEDLLADLREAADAARALPPVEVPAPLVAMVEQVVAAGDEATLGALLEGVGVQGSAVPERMATINTLLQALSVGTREALLTSYLNGLYRQPPG